MKPVLQIALLNWTSDPGMESLLRDRLGDRCRVWSESRGAAPGLVSSDTDVLMICVKTLADELDRELAAVRRAWPGKPVLLAADTDSVAAVEGLLRLGVDDFVTPPFAASDLLPRLARLASDQGRADDARGRLKAKLGLSHLVGDSPAFMAVIERIPRFARCDATVLISGETGTGKEVVARAIHYLSPRRERPFIPVNCGAIPVELVENELFGHHRAAFTGATTSRHGLIQEAEGGTLFLDEVDSLPLPAQVKLLRFLQEKEYRPLGSTEVRIADVRLIVASNVDIEEAVHRGRLRQDLFYRLNVLPLTLPPLRERLEDLPQLARHFVRLHAERLGRPAPVLMPQVLQALAQHPWPGNVRELEHVLERAVILADGPSLGCGEIELPGVEGDEVEPFKEAKARVVARFELAYIKNLLTVYRGNVSRAASAARKNRRAFFELIRKHKIDVEGFRAATVS